jgi:hypothetical protein
MSLTTSSSSERGGRIKSWTEFQTETVACEAWKNVEMNMEDLLTSRFSIRQK